MKQKIYQLTVLLLLCVCSMGSRAANTVTLPSTSILFTDATLSNCKSESEGVNVGSTVSETVITFTLQNNTLQDYILSLKSGSKYAAVWNVTITNNSTNAEVLNSNFNVENIGTWTPTTSHAFTISDLAIGEYTMVLSVKSTTGKYAGNLGNISIANASSYEQIPGAITLKNGTYNGPRVEDAGNVGYVQNKGTASYTFYNSTAGGYNMLIDIARINAATMNVSILDVESGTEEYTNAYAIAADAPTDYTTNMLAISSLSKGLKTLTLTFADGSGYICNYKNLKFEYVGAVASITGVSIGGNAAVKGTDTDWLYNLPITCADATTTISTTSLNGTVTATAKDEANNSVTVTDHADGTFTLPTPATGATTTITFTLAASAGAVVPQSTYTLALFHIGEISITDLTVDGVAADVLTAINTGANYTATLSGNVYTQIPAVSATLVDGSKVTADGVLNGTTATYTLAATIGESTRTFTLKVEGIHVYTPTANDNTVTLKYTGAGKTNDSTWSNGLYTLTSNSGLDGWENSSFKMNGSDYTLSIPCDMKIKQVILRNFASNYDPAAGAKLTALASEGATVFLPTKSTYIHGTNYDLIINLEGHQAGKNITFSLTGGGQPTAYLDLTVENVNPKTAPILQSTTITGGVDKNHCVVALAFDREMKATTATINGKSITAKGGGSTLYFHIWNLNYNATQTLTIAIGAAEDTYGNSNSQAISTDITISAKAVAAKAVYNYVVSTAAELVTAIAGVNTSNKETSASRVTIFLKNGTYNLGSDGQQISAYNVSLIGESRDGVIIYGNRTGISNPVLNLRDRSGFYLQDLTVRNDFDYGKGTFDGVAVALYGGNKTILKNVRLLSNQDTQVTGDRVYIVNSEIHGTVDFICGGGDNFYQNTDLVIEDRGGNCLTAPSTSAENDWGYVFQQCTIKAVEGASNVTDGSYNLGRPWQNEPRCYYLNTTMNVLPSDNGWAGMSNLTTHFYEYNSMDASGNAIDLTKRGNAGTSTNTYTPVLTATEAANFTVENVLGGTDSWLPTEECADAIAPVIAMTDGTISWTDQDDASCYVIFVNGKYLANTTATTYATTVDGIYTVRAANVSGGLGATSNAVVRKATVTTGTTGWASACIAYDAQVPAGCKAYYISAANDNTVTLTEMSTIPAGEGFLFNAVAGTYSFDAAGSEPAAITNLLVGTTQDVTITANSAYVLAKIDETSVGMKRYSGTTIAANHAYLPASSFSSSAAVLELNIGDVVTGITDIQSVNGESSTAVYNLQGQRMATPQSGKLYITNGKKFIQK